MKKRINQSFFFLFLFTLLHSSNLFAVSGIYGGGPIYRDDGSIEELKQSGFTHLIVWTIHIENDGSLGFNGEFPLVQDGKYIGDQMYPEFTNQIASLKKGETSIERVEFGLSAYGSGTYRNIRALVACDADYCGTGPKSILYRNFKALRDAFPDIDALNNDDESEYHLASSKAFHIMLADIGFKTAIVPYVRSSYWQSLVTQVNDARPGAVDLLYLQGYAGGAGNNPCDWDLGLPVIHGLWSKNHSPVEVGTQLAKYKKQCPNVLRGGFMWLYDEFNGSGLVKEYATSINQKFEQTSSETGGSSSSGSDSGSANAGSGGSGSFGLTLVLLVLILPLRKLKLAW